MRIEVPAKLRFLRSPARYKCIYGGRGKGASYGVADALLTIGVERPLRILCSRETQESMDESVHATLSSRIVALGLERFYRIERAKIVNIAHRSSKAVKGDPLAGRAGFSFAGLKHNTSALKSYEGYDIVWVEEAESVSRESWEILIPTIRKDYLARKGAVDEPNHVCAYVGCCSEIWVTFNPKYADDDTYRRFVLQPPANAVVCQMNWRDNPFFPAVSRREMEDLRRTDPDMCDHVWEGHPRSSVVGAIYEQEIKRAELENRITSVPFDPAYPVNTYWDLGFGDMVSIWFAQDIAMQKRVIDYYENTRQAIGHYIDELKARETECGYKYGLAVLPWDGGAKQLGSGKSIEERIRAAGFRTRVLAQARVSDGIDTVRTMFPTLVFDGVKTAVGMNGPSGGGRGGLRRYEWGPKTKAGVDKREPLHNEASHPADALRTMAMATAPGAALRDHYGIDVPSGPAPGTVEALMDVFAGIR